MSASGAVHIYVSGEDNALYVRDEFVDAAALGFHLSNTARDHLPSLLAIAVPGPFLFMGDVPAELQQATEQMQLGAEFSTHTAGFDRWYRTLAPEPTRRTVRAQRLTARDLQLGVGPVELQGRSWSKRCM